MNTFEELNIKKEIVDALQKIGIDSPTDVQEQAIPLIMEGKDLIVRAKTGTGKTFAFVLPILTNLERSSRHVEALILAPTRELALQIEETIIKLKQHGVRSVVVYGGASINTQIDKLRSGANVVIGTPGRIIDLMNRNAIDIKRIKYMVLDEADVMLDMGFIEDVEHIISHTPLVKQSMLFSATVPERLIRTSKQYMNNPTTLSVGEEEDVTVKSISHAYSMVAKNEKFQTLLAYINEYKPRKAVVFVQTKNESNLVHEALTDLHYNAILLHGGLTQAKRERSLKSFKHHGALLIATNVAARGLDIKDISDVINYDVPMDPFIYVHRVGRSARMGKDGRAFTIATRDQKRAVEDIEFAANIEMKELRLEIAKYKEDALVFARKKSRSKFRDQRGGRTDRHYGHRTPRKRNEHSRRSSGGGKSNFEWYKH